MGAGKGTILILKGIVQSTSRCELPRSEFVILLHNASYSTFGPVFLDRTVRGRLSQFRSGGFCGSATPGSDGAGMSKGGEGRRTEGTTHGFRTDPAARRSRAAGEMLAAPPPPRPADRDEGRSHQNEGRRLGSDGRRAVVLEDRSFQHLGGGDDDLASG